MIIMTKLLVDGVFFQVNNTGIARVWRSVLELLVASRHFDIYFLDRGRAPAISGVSYIPFPKYLFTDCAADSLLIQKVCDHYGIDVFTSTYYTTPVATPMVLMVYDMIPELFGFDLSQRAWMEKNAAISFAQRYLCISHNTRKDLLAFYPDIPGDRAVVAHCGVDETVFHPRPADAVGAFRKQYRLDRPYFIFVGSRVQHNGYKNSSLFFDALKTIPGANFDVLCVGGEKTIEDRLLESLPASVRCQRVEMTDDELAIAYCGALALVYPSLYEGFGMPVIEAMASGCPVITTHHGSLFEAAGEAACLIGGTSVDEMKQALERMLNENERRSFHEKGLVHSLKFRWQPMADLIADQVKILAKETRAGAFASFFGEWKRLRQIQASVDYHRSAVSRA
jgi:glycosyltransferase involved in cell wall biosynthesis